MCVCVCAYSMHMLFYRCCYLTGSFSCDHTNPPKTKAESEKEMKEEWLLTKTTETTNSNRLSTILNKRFFLSVFGMAQHAKLTVEKSPVWKDSGYWCRSNGELMKAHTAGEMSTELWFFFSLFKEEIFKRPYTHELYFYQDSTRVFPLNFTASLVRIQILLRSQNVCHCRNISGRRSKAQASIHFYWTKCH